MATARFSDAELHLLVRWLKIAVVGALVTAFAFGAWVARLQGQVEKIPSLEARGLDNARAIEDLVLLRCSDTTLNLTAQRICAKYEPRMPR